MRKPRALSATASIHVPAPALLDILELLLRWPTLLRSVDVQSTHAQPHQTHPQTVPSFSAPPTITTAPRRFLVVLGTRSLGMRPSRATLPRTKQLGLQHRTHLLAQTLMDVHCTMVAATATRRPRALSATAPIHVPAPALLDILELLLHWPTLIRFLDVHV